MFEIRENNHCGGVIFQAGKPESMLKSSTSTVIIFKKIFRRESERNMYDHINENNQLDVNSHLVPSSSGKFQILESERNMYDHINENNQIDVNSHLVPSSSGKFQILESERNMYDHINENNQLDVNSHLVPSSSRKFQIFFVTIN